MTETASLPAIDAALEPLVAAGEFAGMATLCWQGDRLVHRAAYGLRDLTASDPMRTDTVVRAFSMTKPVTAVAMMILRDRGLWSPDDPIARHLPELAELQVFRGLDADGKPILSAPETTPTLRHLLTHTAGLSYGNDVGYVDDCYREAAIFEATSADDFIRRVAGLPLRYEPGAEWFYSIAMDVQGAIIERLSGLSLAEFLQREIFGPLGMGDTAFHCPAEKRPRLAAVYNHKHGALRELRRLPLSVSGDGPPGFASGGGGLYSTAEDYLRFARMLLGCGALDGVRIISEAAAAEMMTSQLSPEFVAKGWGIGFQTIRPGYAYGYNGVVVTDPQAAGVAMGLGSYLWDGFAGTWFWVDPEHDVAFVGMIQRVALPEMPAVQPISQRAVAEALGF